MGKNEQQDDGPDLMQQTHIEHPNPRTYTVVDEKPVFGRWLKPGETLRATDVYASTSGKWEPCPCPGMTLEEGAEQIWVRPYKAGVK